MSTDISDSAKKLVNFKQKFRTMLELEDSTKHMSKPIAIEDIEESHVTGTNSDKGLCHGFLHYSWYFVNQSFWVSAKDPVAVHQLHLVFYRYDAL